MLRLQHVSKRLGEKDVLKDFSHTFAEGEIACLMGPSGCGKTTLLRLAAGLLPPDAGEVLMPGDTRASFVFQEDRLLPWYDALGNLTAIGIDAQAALHALDDFSLSEDVHTLPDRMSGGMRRRLAIARAMAYDGDVFFLDEPLRSLDDATAKPVLSAMRRQIASKTGLLITHSPSEAFALGDRLLLAIGPPLRIMLTAPIHAFADAAALQAWVTRQSLPQGSSQHIFRRDVLQ